MPISGKPIEGLAEQILTHYGDYSDIIKLQRENLTEHLQRHNRYGVFLHQSHYQKPAELIPTCSQGLVVDFCLQVPAERIRSFTDKWNLSLEKDGTDFSDEQRMEIHAENPLAININPKVILNGTVLSSSHGCGVSWNPCSPEGNGLEAKSVTHHYGLDPAYDWAIWRAAFP